MRLLHLGGIVSIAIAGLALLTTFCGNENPNSQDSNENTATQRAAVSSFVPGWGNTVVSTPTANDMGAPGGGWMENTAVAFPPNVACPLDGGATSGPNGTLVIHDGFVQNPVTSLSTSTETAVLARVGPLNCTQPSCFTATSPSTHSFSTYPLPSPYDDHMEDTEDSNLVRLPNGHLLLSRGIVRYGPTKNTWVCACDGSCSQSHVSCDPNGAKPTNSCGTQLTCPGGASDICIQPANCPRNPGSVGPAGSFRRGMIAIFDSADCGQTFKEIGTLDPGPCGDLDRPMMFVDPFSSPVRVYVATNDGYDIQNNPSGFCSGTMHNGFELYEAPYSSSLTFGSPVYTTAWANPHAETVLQDHRVYMAQCIQPAGQLGQIGLGFYDPAGSQLPITGVTNATSYPSPLTCDAPFNGTPSDGGPRPNLKVDLNMVSVSRIGTLSDGDYVRVTWPNDPLRTAGGNSPSNQTRVQSQVVKITGSTLTNVGSPTTIATSSYPNGAIVQFDAIETNPADLPATSLLNDTFYIWQDAQQASVSYSSFGNELKVFGSVARDINSFTTLPSLIHQLESGWQIDGDYMQGASYYDPIARSMNFIPIWPQNGGGQSHEQYTANVVVNKDDAFTAFQNLGGGFSAPPTAVSWAPGHLDVFSLDWNSNVIHNQYDVSTGRWSGYDTGPGNPPPGVNPTTTLAAASTAVGRIDLFAFGADCAMWHTSRDNSYGGNHWFGSWENLGGCFGGKGFGASAQPAQGRLDVFGFDWNGNLVDHFYTPSGGWQWASLGTPQTGALSLAPAAASWGAGRIDVVALGSDSAIQHIHMDPSCPSGGWCSWDVVSFGGQFSSAPTIASWASNHLDVFAGGGSSPIYHWSLDQGVTSTWLSVAGSTGSPSAVSWGPGRLDVFTTYANGSILQATSAQAVPAITTKVRGFGGKCIDLAGGNTANGTPIQYFTCNGGANQQWTFTAAGEIRGIGGKCWDLPGTSTANNTLIQYFTCNGGANQKWTIQPDGTIRADGGRCLDLPGSNTTDGTQLQIFDCNQGTNQDWVIAGLSQ